MRLKDARRTAAMSQADLAEAVGVSRSTVAMWETEKSHPSLSQLVKLCEILGVDSDFLLETDRKNARAHTGKSILNEKEADLISKLSKDKKKLALASRITELDAKSLSRLEKILDAISDGK